MTIWTPRLPKSDTPIYRRIADALERDLAAGVVLPGGRLPAVRDLATRLGVTPVTISRAYAEAAERGLLETHVGRGTFVRASVAVPAGDGGGEVDLTTNEVPVASFPPLPQERIAAELAASYRTGGGSERHRSAGAAYIGGDASPSRVLVTNGAQHALSLAFSTLLDPGDTLLTDPHVYSGVKTIAAQQRLKFAPLPSDRFGVLPDALERAARDRVSRVVYLTPTLQNPTGVVMPEKRRRDLATIAELYGLILVEDDVYGFLHPAAPVPIRTFAPERTLFVTSVGKSIAAGLRIGFALAPDWLTGKLAAALAANSLAASGVAAEIVAHWIEDGTATRLIKQKRETIAQRRRLANRVLGEWSSAADERSAHLWLELPKRWNPDAFAREAQRRGVRVCSASVFATGSEPARAIRVSLGSARSATELESALTILRSVAASPASAAAPETIV